MPSDNEKPKTGKSDGHWDLHSSPQARPVFTDDDEALAFVENADPTQIAALDISTLKTLLQAMFCGFTGDDEEIAIVKLIRHSKSTTVRSLVSQKGFSVDDFDSEVDGDEWDQLVVEFERHGVAVP